MNFLPFFQSDLAIQIHAASASIAVLLGAIIIMGKKGNAVHMTLGGIWFVSMVFVVASSAFISEIRLIGPFSPLHIFTLLGSWALIMGIYHIRKGNTVAHGATMKSLYFWGLGVAGTLAFLPGRTMNAILFPQAPVMGFYFILAVFLIVLAINFGVASRVISRFRARQMRH